MKTQTRDITQRLARALAVAAVAATSMVSSVASARVLPEQGFDRYQCFVECVDENPGYNYECFLGCFLAD
jgi:hypothetical protein